MSIEQLAALFRTITSRDYKNILANPNPKKNRNGKLPIIDVAVRYVSFFLISSSWVQIWGWLRPKRAHRGPELIKNIGAHWGSNFFHSKNGLTKNNKLCLF